MRHCIDGYLEACEAGDYRAFSIQDAGTAERIVTIGMFVDEGRWVIEDVRGQDNALADESLWELADSVRALINRRRASQRDLFEEFEEHHFVHEGERHRLFVPTTVEATWLQSVADRRQAEALLRYGRAFNLLDPSWVVGAIADAATYDSQEVLEILQGGPKIADYLSDKIATLQQALTTTSVRMELGHHRAVGCCVVAHQWDVATDQVEPCRPVGLMTIKVDGTGRINRFSMVTSAPNPAEAVRTGIFPGR